MSNSFVPDFVPDVPGSRSIAARALVCASLAAGQNIVFNAPSCDDTDAITACLQSLAANAQISGKKTELASWPAISPRGVLDCNASGTTMRFISALSILTDKDLVLTGTSRLLERPMAGLNEVLQAVGKSVVDAGGQRTISGVPNIPDELTVDASTSGQFVSGLMMALGAAGKPTVLRAVNPVSIPFITMTVSVMRSFGAQLDVHNDGNNLVFYISGTGYKHTEFFVEPDIMSANYFLAAAAITGKSVFIPGIARETIQGDIEFVYALENMGATIEFIDGGIRSSLAPGARLVGANVDLAKMPDMSLTIASLAAIAQGPTTMTSARILQFKESDRRAVIVDELAKLGAVAHVSADKDTITITPAAALENAAIDTYEDHRVAMAFGLLTLVNPKIVINDPHCVAKTWPDFFGELERYKNFGE